MENKHGGKREGAGRKSKADETDLIAQMDSVCSISTVLEKLVENIEANETNAIKLWLSYRFGMPKQIIESKTELTVETPIELTNEQFIEALETIKPK